jgi:hypothetical protein
VEELMDGIAVPAGLAGIAGDDFFDDVLVGFQKEMRLVGKENCVQAGFLAVFDKAGELNVRSDVLFADVLVWGGGFRMPVIVLKMAVFVVLREVLLPVEAVVNRQDATGY